MANEKFTPGPWEVTGADRNFIAKATDDPTDIGSIFATLWMNIDRERHNQEANAALIAAAPEMYDVIDRLVPWLENDPNADSDEYCSFAKEMRRVLKKARGES